MNNVEEDDWVREFDVSNPQKTHAGYTVYRISSKVYPKGCPEAASEVIVFKRYREIRVLYKQLKIIYESKNLERKKFPHFSKSHYFGRFDISVLEERQKQALSLLSFAGNISFLFTSQPFVKFFEGGVEHGSVGSQNSSDSDQPATPQEPSVDATAAVEAWTPELYFDENVEKIEGNSSDDETIYEKKSKLLNPNLQLDCENGQADDCMKAWLARAMSLCSEGDDIEILASEAGCLDESMRDKVKGYQESTLGSFNDLENEVKENSQSATGGVDLLPVLLESSDDEEQEVFVEISSPKKEDSCEDEHSSVTKPERGGEVLPSATACELCSKNEQENINKVANVSSIISTLVENLPVEKDEKSSERKKSSEITERTSGNQLKGRTDQSKDSEKLRKQVGRTVSNIAMSWIDPKKKDYLYQAAQIIQEALYNEAHEMYEEAFNKYKMCVGLLLNGVQHDSDAKRREAVRRKTAQYLVKAEFLFNTYLKHDDKDVNDWTVQSPCSSHDIVLQTIVDRRFTHVNLRNLKVIGVIRKFQLLFFYGKTSYIDAVSENECFGISRVPQGILQFMQSRMALWDLNMLVQCPGLDGVFVVKVLHKTNAVHRINRQDKQTNKSFTKKYVRSNHMVKLHQHFDSDNSIFLLLEYAAGGTLWSHVKSLRGFLYTCKDILGSTGRNAGVQECTESVEVTLDVQNKTSDASKEHAQHSEPSPHGAVTSRDGSCENVGKNCGEKDDVQSLKDASFSRRDIFNMCDTDNNVYHLKFSENITNRNTRKSLTEEDDDCNAHRMFITQPPEDEGMFLRKCGSVGQVNLSGKFKNVQTDTSCHISRDSLTEYQQDATTINICTMEKCVQRWIAELLLAIESLHTCGIILKDLKPSNVLLDGSGRVVLSYFGVWEEVDHSVDPEAVENYYCAPEIFRGEKITFAADWWSLGVLSYELITRKTLVSTHPWGIYPHSSIVFPCEDISTESRSFLSGLICHNVGERLGSGIDGVECIKSHAFFQGVDWHRLSQSR